MVPMVESGVVGRHDYTRMTFATKVMGWYGYSGGPVWSDKTGQLVGITIELEDIPSLYPRAGMIIRLSQSIVERLEWLSGGK